MLEGKQIIDKLYGEADLFVHHMRKKEYPQAKFCYDTARNVAVFLELEEKRMQELFGERGDKGEILQPGMFREEQVQKAYLECIRAGQTYENKRYESLQKNSA